MTDHLEKAQEAIDKAKRKALIHLLEDIGDKLQLAYHYTTPSFGISFEDKLFSHIRDCLILAVERLPKEEIEEVSKERYPNSINPFDGSQGKAMSNAVRPLGGFTCS